MFSRKGDQILFSCIHVRLNVVYELRIGRDGERDTLSQTVVFVKGRYSVIGIMYTRVTFLNSYLNV